MPFGLTLVEAAAVCPKLEMLADLAPILPQAQEAIALEGQRPTDPGFATAMAYTGTLKKFMDGKGFGFIENSDGSGDVFVHFSQLTNGGSDDMIVGAEMSFDIEEDPRSGKTKATNVTLSNGGSGGGKGGYGGYDSGKGKGKGKGKRYDPY